MTCGERDTRPLHQAILDMVDYLTDSMCRDAVEDNILDLVYTESIERDTGIKTMTIEITYR